MKKNLKLFSAAFAVLALASCSNDDIFNGEKNVNAGKLQLIATVEAPASSDDNTTRAAWYGQNVNVIWQAGDHFRVYDAALQKYDNFVCKLSGETKTIELADAKASVDAHAMAIFPGNKVTYAGWDKSSDVVTATMEIPATMKYGDAIVSGMNTGFASDLPMWGVVANETSNDLEVDLKHLTAYTDITVYQKAATKIRVIAADKTDYKNNQSKFENDAITGKYDNQTAGAEKPLTGYFDAQLKEGGALVANWSNAAIAEKFGYVITVDLTANTSDECHVYIPIIPQKYGKLVIQSYNGSAWSELKAYTDQTVSNNVVLRKGLTIGNAPITAVVESLADLNTKLATIASGEDYKTKVVNISVAEGKTVATTEALQTLNIPTTLSADMNVNFLFAIDNSTTNLPLKITGGATGQTAKIKIKGGISGTENINIECAGPLELSGSFTSSNANHNTMTIATTQGTSLGKGNEAPFSTTMNVVIKDDVTIDGGTGSISNVDWEAATSTQTITVTSGTVANIGAKKAGAGTVTINGGTVTNVKNANAAVIVNGGEVANITSDNDVTIAANVTGIQTVTTKGALTTSSPIAVEAKMLTAGKAVTITGVNVQKLTAGFQSGNSSVSSTGAASIMEVSDDAKFTFTSTWDGKKAAVGAANKIYTAAQLGGMAAGTNYTLLTTVSAFNQSWVSLDYSATFDGNGKTLYNLNAPLFKKISAGTVKKLTLSGVNINNKNANQGAIAQEVAGTVTIQEVEVAATSTIGAATGDKDTKNIGGLVGKSSGALTIKDCKVNATVKGYANVGGYVGNLAGGSLTANLSKETSLQSSVTFVKSFSLGASVKDMNCGTFGNFIGSITGENATVSIGSANAKEYVIGKFFEVISAGVSSSTISGLEYGNNKNASNAGFKGMQGTAKRMTLTYEIGYSPVKAVSSVNMYGITKDELGNPITLDINDINQY